MSAWLLLIPALWCASGYIIGKMACDNWSKRWGNEVPPPMGPLAWLLCGPGMLGALYFEYVVKGRVR